MTILGHLEQHPGLNPPDFTATATVVTDNSIEIDQTFYYPMGGGQPADKVIISTETFECVVTDVTKKNSVLHHIGGANGELQSGDTVHCSIDTVWRNQLSTMHTAQHLISALAHEEWGANTEGTHNCNESTRIDLQIEDREA